MDGSVSDSTPGQPLEQPSPLDTDVAGSVEQAVDISEETVISHLQRVGSPQSDAPPTQKEVLLDPNAPSPSDIISLFDSWMEAIIAAGYSPASAANQHREVSTIEIISGIKQLSSDGVAPTQQGYNTHPDTPATTTVKRRIGWKTAVKQAGLELHPKTVEKRINQPNHVSESEMIAAMKRLSVDGVAPTQKRYNEDDDSPAASTVKRRIGWEEAAERAGVTLPD